MRILLEPVQPKEIRPGDLFTKRGRGFDTEPPDVYIATSPLAESWGPLYRVEVHRG